ncbi:MAG TPA: porin [Thermoanaerobaculia bacterium]|nr:porin [Thermoanaerobaculia bacterium]
MTRHPHHSIARLVLAATALAAALAALAPAAARAQAILKVNDDVWLRLGLQLNGQADWTQSAATGGYAQNLFLRRDRFLVTGSVAPGVTFYFQTDDVNLGKAPKALATGFVIQDAWMEWKLADAFALDAGQFIVPWSRNSLQGTLSYLTMDISPTSTIIINPNPADAARDTGVEAKGYLVDGGRLEYRVALTQGVRETSSRNAFRDTVYLQYDVFDTERGYVYHGTNLGKKKILALSTGYDGQSSYHAYNADVFTTLPVGAGDEIAGQVQWSHYDGESFLPAPARQNDYLVELAYFASALKAQPFAKFERQRFSAGNLQQKNMLRWGAGMHYYVHGLNLKLSAQFLRVLPEKPIRDTNELTLAMQVWYF